MKKKLTVLGTFSEGIDAETKAKLAEDFRQIRRKTPFVETSLTAKWVQPVYLCEVSYLLDKKERPRDCVSNECWVSKAAAKDGT